MQAWADYLNGLRAGALLCPLATWCTLLLASALGMTRAESV